MLWQHAVEHIYTTRHTLDQIFRLRHPSGTRMIGGIDGASLQRPRTQLFYSRRLSYDGVAVKLYRSALRLPRRGLSATPLQMQKSACVRSKSHAGTRRSPYFRVARVETTTRRPPASSHSMIKCLLCVASPGAHRSNPYDVRASAACPARNSVRENGTPSTSSETPFLLWIFSSDQIQT